MATTLALVGRRQRLLMLLIWCATKRLGGRRRKASLIPICWAAGGIRWHDGMAVALYRNVHRIAPCALFLNEE